MSAYRSNSSNSIGQSRPEFYMPLSSSSLTYGVTGPSHCVFSTPKVTYSKNTHALVNLLAKESKLTHSQRNGFQAILRSGNSLPLNWDDAITRRKEYNFRKIMHARKHGLNIEQQRQQYNSSDRYRTNTFFGSQVYLPGAKRSLESIKASGALEPPSIQPSYSRNYIPPKNKEEEKARFAHKMAFGKNPSPNNPMPLSPGRTRRLPSTKNREESMDQNSLNKVKHERFNELIQEIQERIEFVQTMATVKHDKSYRPFIVVEIKEKLNEMRQLCPEKFQEEYVKLKLDRVDNFFVQDA